MAWDLRGNYDDELARARLIGRLTPAQINQIYPAYDYEAHPPILGGDEWSPQVPDRATQSAVPSALTTSPTPPPPGGCRRVTGRRPAHQSRRRRPRTRRCTTPSNAVPQLVGRGEGIGSNSWVVSGARTTTGKPLLANDPHLGVEPARHLDPEQPALPHRVAGLPARRQRLLVRRACRASSSATTPTSPGASPTSGPTSPTSTSSGSSATPTCATATGSRSPPARRSSRSPAAPTSASRCAAPSTGR